MIITVVQPLKISVPLQSGNPKYPSTHRSHLAPVISTDLQVQFPTLLQVWLVDPLTSQPQAKLNQSVLLIWLIFLFTLTSGISKETWLAFIT